ncbi:hypothetical protein BDF21DRAFT_444188 [Thamnidium elegans]|nr:hypothetical protein BDF21DRAFT_444188 [Thamnidium elegans]
MFRKAKRLSKRLGINKERCTEKTTSSNYDINKSYSLASEQPTQPPPLVPSVNNVTGSTASDDYDTISSESSSNDEFDISPSKERPIFGKSQTEPNKKNLYDTPDNNLTSRLSMIDTGNLDLLLSMETQARIEAQAKREQDQLEQAQQQETMSAPRPTKIKFELPVTPPRSRSPTNPRLQYPRARPVRSLPEEGLTANIMRHPLPNNNSNNKNKRIGWRHLFSDRDDEETKHIPLPITVGSRVKLKLRPLPTFGYVRFIGNVEPENEEYVGVELDHGVGNCDGTRNGKRYFHTDVNRGIYCAKRDLEAVHE